MHKAYFPQIALHGKNGASMELLLIIQSSQCIATSGNVRQKVCCIIFLGVVAFCNMSAGNEKKSQNLSTCRATPSQEIKLKKAIKLKGFRRPSDFWFRCMETFIEQVDAQQDLLWPLQFAQRIPNSAQPKKLPPKKKGA